MSDATNDQLVLRRLSSTEDRHTCWVCFGTDEDIRLDWVTPCRCKGTAKWVHVRCLQRWVDEKQKNNATADVSCPQCNQQYGIVYPQMGVGMKVLDIVEKYINKICPFAAGCFIFGSAYWTAVTYGAVTVMQVLGHKEGLNVMEQADPLFLLLGLPTIPFGLFVAKLLRWEEAVLRVWRKHSSKLPFFGSLYQGTDTWTTSSDVAEDRIPVSYTRVVVGAMFFPTISTLVGKLFFGSVKSNAQRSLLGGLSFFLVKGALRMYYMQMTFMRRSQRRIENYEAECEPVGEN